MSAFQLGYFVIGVADLEGAKRFFGELMGWTFDDGGPSGNPQYAHVANSTLPFGLHATGAADLSNLYFRVSDAAAVAAQARSLGGQATEPSESVTGWSATVTDPGGTIVGIWQPKEGY